MKKGGFVLRKWNSNSKVLQDRIEKDTLSEGTQTTSSSVFESGREIDSKQHSMKIAPVNILGSNWNVETDKFQFGVKELVEYTKTLPPTKRSVLKASAKIFDPIGILSPFTVKITRFYSSCFVLITWIGTRNSMENHYHVGTRCCKD